MNQSVVYLFLRGNAEHALREGEALRGACSGEGNHVRIQRDRTEISELEEDRVRGVSAVCWVLDCEFRPAAMICSQD